jgi:6-phosphofructokinase
VLGIRRGWEGLTHLRPGPELDSEYVRPLNRTNTRTIDRTGGTVLHTSRTNPARMLEGHLPAHLPAEQLAGMATAEGTYDLTPVVLENIERLGITHLVPIGGDDTLGYGHRLVNEGVPLIAIPKTKELINRQRTTLGSHERIGVFRIFGRNSGYTAWYAAYVTSARCVIPEAEFDLDLLAELLTGDRSANPSRYAFVIASEGAIWRGGTIAETGEADAYGHRHKADVGYALAEELRRRTGIETVNSDLTYDLRSGDPDALDQMVAITFANAAMDLLADGQTGRMVGIRAGKYAHSPLPDPKLGPRKIDVGAMYNLERLRPQYSQKLGSPLMLGTSLEP